MKPWIEKVCDMSLIEEVGWEGTTRKTQAIQEYLFLSENNTEVLS